MNVIVRTGGDEAVSLLVDGIGDVLEVDEDSSEPPPETLKGATRDLVKRIYKLDGSLLLVLDAEKAADMSECLDPEPRSMSPELRN